MHVVRNGGGPAFPSGRLDATASGIFTNSRRSRPERHRRNPRHESRCRPAGGARGPDFTSIFRLHARMDIGRIGVYGFDLAGEGVSMPRLWSRNHQYSE